MMPPRNCDSLNLDSLNLDRLGQTPRLQDRKVSRQVPFLESQVSRILNLESKNGTVVLPTSQTRVIPALKMAVVSRVLKCRWSDNVLAGRLWWSLIFSTTC